MSFAAIVDEYIGEYRPRARGELAELRKLRTLKEAIRHAVLCLIFAADQLMEPFQGRGTMEYVEPARCCGSARNMKGIPPPRG